MPVEIERKFLVLQDCLPRLSEGEAIRQGYLPTRDLINVRVRIAGDSGILTVKGPSEGNARAEFEYEIPLADAEEMQSNLCLKPLVRKTRHQISFGGVTWELDVFEGENEGLVVAEIELESSGQQIELPVWVGLEVTDDRRYKNAALVARPYCEWGN